MAHFIVDGGKDADTALKRQYRKTTSSKASFSFVRLRFDRLASQSACYTVTRSLSPQRRQLPLVKKAIWNPHPLSLTSRSKCTNTSTSTKTCDKEIRPRKVVQRRKRGGSDGPERARPALRRWCNAVEKKNRTRWHSTKSRGSGFFSYFNFWS